MTVKLEIPKPLRNLEKYIKSKKNHSKPLPKLWPDSPQRPTIVDDNGNLILNLSHPILRKLDSCSSLKQFNQVHAQVLVSGLFQHPLSASRCVKKLCSDLHMVSRAVSLFDRFEVADAFLCNTIMRGYVNLDDPDRARSFYYERMVGNFIFPNHYTFPLVLKACVEVGSLREGEKIHSCVVKHGFEFDLFVRNSLIHLYSSCGRVSDARVLFDEGPVRDLVSWNSMIDGHVKNGQVGFARELFDEMQERDLFSWNSIISGYVGIKNMEEAKRLFDIMPHRDVVSWNCMIEGYAKVGNVFVAREFFDGMPLRNVVSWNTMLALYVRCRDHSRCLNLFNRMIEEGKPLPNEASFVSALTACANLGRLETGRWIHSYIQTNCFKPDVLLSTALLTMYAKCGAMDIASSVFNEMSERNVVSWNSMIMGYGMYGQGDKALELFLKMKKNGITPNDATFICLLSACNHSGLIFEGWWCFDQMYRIYKIEPKVEHYGCMVDLLARSGLMKDSEELIKSMPMNAGPALWGALLSSCRTHSYLELAETVSNRLMELEPKDVGPYILLSNIYAAEGKWEDVERVRKMMKEKNLQKATG